ncbi:MAG: hypothetical protein ACRDY7_00040, partial [Acidimicrobiia bacterium]
MFGDTDCEHLRDGLLAQPANALTSLAYVAAGAEVLRQARRARAPLAAAGGVALMGVGAGSYAFHGPQPSWADAAHN